MAPLSNHVVKGLLLSYTVTVNSLLVGLVLKNIGVFVIVSAFKKFKWVLGSSKPPIDNTPKNSVLNVSWPIQKYELLLAYKFAYTHGKLFNPLVKLIASLIIVNVMEYLPCGRIEPQSILYDFIAAVFSKVAVVDHNEFNVML